PGQRWYYFPQLAPDEAILIKGYDSAEDVARFTAHSAFEDPQSPANAPERESIEVRALVIY
ncbi:CmcJ/NvfI family oxidoreductase, partial [Allosphingosinicella sp.]|uniref:CmcJ/NvfI family oxidoreductase n=1 Tax=Allosphingosinicella sp. TaxID=2823234 RepID=UPI00378493FF